MNPRMIKNGLLIIRPVCRLVCASLLAVAAGSGCDSMRAGPMSPEQDQAPSDRRYDPSKAFLTLDEIKPRPARPEPAAGRPEPSARAARRLVTARSLLQEDRYTEAIRELEKALRYDPNCFEVHRMLAIVCTAAGNDARAAVHIRRASEICSDDVAIRYLTGKAAVNQRDLPAAILELRTALLCSNAEADREFAALARYHLARTLHAAGYVTAAIEQFAAFEKCAAGLDPEAIRNAELSRLLKVSGWTVPQQVAGAYEDLGEFDKAAETLGVAVSLLDTDLDLRKRYAEVLVKAGRYDDAAAQARYILVEDPEAVGLLADVYRSSGQPDRVLDDLAELVAKFPERAAYLFAYVDELAVRSRWQSAEQALRAFLESHPDQLDVFWKLYDVLRRQERYTDALEVLADVIAANAECYLQACARLDNVSADAEARRVLKEQIEAISAPGDMPFAQGYLLGMVASSLKDYPAAEALLQASLSKNPDFYPAAVALGDVYLATYRWDKAIRTGQATLERGQEKSAVYRLLGRAYEGLDKVDEARSSYSDALRLNRNDVDSMLALGRMAERAGEENTAIRQYRTLLKVDPLNTAARESLMILLWEGNTDESIRILSEMKAQEADPGAIARCEAHMVGVRLRDPKQYRQVLSAALERNPADVKTRLRMAESLIRELNYQNAEELLRENLRLASDDTESMERLFLALHPQLEYDESLKLLDELLSRHPNRLAYRQTLIELLLTVQDTARLRTMLTRYLEDEQVTDRARIYYRVALKEVVLLDGEVDEAIDLTRRWMGEEPDNDMWRGWLCDVLSGAERYDELIELTEGWLSEAPEDNRARNLFLLALSQGEAFDRLCQVLLDWLETDRGNPALTLQLARALGLDGRWDAAIELWRNVEAETPGSQQVQEWLHQFYGWAGQYDKAIVVIGKLLRRHREDPTAGLDPVLLRRQWANLLIQAGRYKDAEAKINDWLKLNQSTVDKALYHRLLSFCYQTQKKDELTTYELERVLELLPEGAALSPQQLDIRVGTLNDLGYTWADAGKNLQKSEEMIRFAVGQQPRRAAYLDSLGWVRYKRDDPESAHKWLARAARIPPEVDFDRGSSDPGGHDPVIFDHLGDVCWRLDRRDEALECWNRAIQEANKRLEEDDEDDVSQDVLETAARKIESAQDGGEPEIAPFGDET